MSWMKAKTIGELVTDAVPELLRRHEEFRQATPGTMTVCPVCGARYLRRLVPVGTRCWEYSQPGFADSRCRGFVRIENREVKD